MVASTLKFNGIDTAVPGAYSKVNASAFASADLGATGIVALVATGVGGKPYSAIASPNDDLQRAQQTGQTKALFREGDLREMGVVLFDPAKDEEIGRSGAQQVIFVKANPAAQSHADFSNADGPALRLTSADYGGFTTQISAKIQNATSGVGKLVTVIFENTTEMFDLLGGVAKFSLAYTGGSTKATTATAAPAVTAFATPFTQAGAAASLEVVSDSASDTTETITVYGTNASDVPTITTTTVTGLTAAAISGTWNSVIDAVASAACVGQITIRKAAAGATVAVSGKAFQSFATRADAGQDTGVTQATSAALLEVLSSSAGDTTQTLTVYGLDASNVPQLKTVTMNGTSVVAISGTWNAETAVVLSATAAGTVTLRVAGAGATVVTLTTGQLNKGRVALDIATKGFLAVAASGSTTKKVVYRGLTAAGGSIAEVLTLAGATSVALGGAFVRVTSVELLAVEAARTVTLSTKMVNASISTYPTLQKLKDLITANPDFTWVTLSGDLTQIEVDDLDIVSAASILNVAVSFYAKLFDIVAGINAKSSLVTAAALTPGTGVPSNTTSAVFLAGGHEGDPLAPSTVTATTGDWQAAIDLLRQTFKNTIVLASTDASIHAYGVAHCEFMGGAGKQECDLVVPAAADETKAALKARMLALNSRHVRLCGQEVALFDSAGVRTWQPPKFQAAICAGMQAGASVGTPLTSKFANVLGVRQNATVNGWNPVDDGDEMIRAGLWFMKFEQNKGFKVVRNVTTYLQDSNLAYIEASVNQASNTSVYRLRTVMEAAIGKKGFARTINAAQAIADGELAQQVKDELIAGYKKPAMSLTLDALTVEVEESAISPINFAAITVNLKPFSITV